MDGFKNGWEDQRYLKAMVIDGGYSSGGEPF